MDDQDDTNRLQQQLRVLHDVAALEQRAAMLTQEVIANERQAARLLQGIGKLELEDAARELEQHARIIERRALQTAREALDHASGVLERERVQVARSDAK